MSFDLSAREIMEKLISFPTVSSESNLELITWVEEYLGHYDIKSTRVYNDDKTKANLYANVGPMVDGGVILSGHTDVVPVVGQDWDTDPFTVVEKDGKFFGRGTCDMKGFDALALASIPKALEKGIKRPIQIALSYDEEVGCIGAPFMAAEMAKLMPKASAAIIGEPSMMKAVSGHKGGLGIKTHVRGFEVHSSLQHIGVNAIMEGAKLIEWANQMNIENEAKERDEATSSFVPPYTTVHVGIIEGGTANNITAKDCHFVMGFRCIPSEDANNWKQAYETKVREIEAEMKVINSECFIALSTAHGVPGLKPEENGVAEALVRKLTGDNGQHVVSYGTEAGQFQAEGYSSIICGPGDIAQAHQANEFITIKQFEAGEAFLDRLIDDLRQG
jgi:acetylornithine deacetylase